MATSASGEFVDQYVYFFVRQILFTVATIWDGNDKKCLWNVDSHVCNKVYSWLLLSVIATYEAFASIVTLLARIACVVCTGSSLKFIGKYACLHF